MSLMMLIWLGIVVSLIVVVVVIVATRGDQ